MNRRKKLRLISVLCSVLCIALAMVLCFVLTRNPFFNPRVIYGNNSLITRENDSYHMGKGITGAFDENGKIEFSIKFFSGSRTVSILNIDEGENLSCTWDIAVSSGQFKLVLVDTAHGKMVETICEGSGIGSIDDLELPAGEYRIKSVGDRASVEGQLKIELSN